MAHPESSDRLGEIIQAERGPLDQAEAKGQAFDASIDRTEGRLADALALRRRAEIDVESASKTLSNLETQRLSNRFKIQRIARAISARIAADQEMPEADRTLGALIFGDGTIESRGVGGFFAAAQEGREALDALLTRVREPGEPVVTIDEHEPSVEVRAAVTAPETIQIEPPTYIEGSKYYAKGSIKLQFPDSSRVIVSEDPLNQNYGVQFVQGSHTIVAISNDPDEGIDHLLELSRNDSQIVIGKEAIEARISTWRPASQVAALLAMQEAGVELTNVLGEQTTANVERSLTSMIVALAYDQESELSSTSVRRHKALTTLVGLDQDNLLNKSMRAMLTRQPDQSHSPGQAIEQTAQTRLHTIIRMIFGPELSIETSE